MASTTSRLAICAASSLLLASKCGDKGAISVPAADIGRWEALTRDQLEQLWQEAQATAGVLAVEPETTVVGSPAAKKKTWAVADGTLKFFSYGYEPIWFPADVIRRTVCGSDARWSYFWHSFSGDESDLHPWFDGGKAFEGLLGEGGSALPGVVDAARCREVVGGTGT